MKTLTLIAFVMISGISYSQENTEISEKIIALEKAALQRWNNGDVYGFLELSAQDVVYFDPMVGNRVDGLQKLTEMYKQWQGKIKITDCEMISPKVQAVQNMAVLTFNLKSKEGDKSYKWNCTEVYRLEQDGNWKIIQTHWSYTQPELK